MRGGLDAIPGDFTALLVDVKERILAARTRAVLAVNAELVRLYWEVGRIIHERQKTEGWGAAVIPRLSSALKNELPEAKGFSERNIRRMFAFCSPSFASIQRWVMELCHRRWHKRQGGLIPQRSAGPVEPGGEAGFVRRFMASRRLWGCTGESSCSKLEGGRVSWWLRRLGGMCVCKRRHPAGGLVSSSRYMMKSTT